MSGVLEVTILGCGSSGGVPRADGDWGVCDPGQPKNRRTRCSLLVRRRAGEGEAETTVLVDTSPDFREQAIAAEILRLDAVLYSHDHADQAHGIDDVRAFFLRQRARIPAWMDAPTRESLLKRFDYIFEDTGGYPAILEARDLPQHGRNWRIEGPSGPVPVTTFDQDHGAIRCVGYRFGGPRGGVAYSPDVNGLPEAAFEALADLDVWIVDALRYTPHPTHAHLDKTLEWIARVKPKRAILTNMHIDMDYDSLWDRLPEAVEPAHDGLTVEIAL
ncbi:MBL fold metallo-hydrolase [Caulobacter mirabilis]|uniref:Phosphoribosyl 1,2-cyclic phosphodiesterase n=1 Tax=Caulobacter mirabilis TaxID=69666 RepID=A0A2D2AY08_9CAUL|nr:MBL fold metallo-hydrolase [Caulobacter mirabilis]ATQ42900.1 phosphoribosyl 1,2-cyclic phosphodiesterase [Caulobacter mirabilis]